MLLLTGATGFVGRQVSRALAERGHGMRLALREGAPCPVVEGANVELLETPDLFEAGRDWWAASLAGVDTVIHLAWYAEPGKYLSSPRNLDCLRGTIVLAQACIDAGVRRFVGVGSCAEYDLTRGLLGVDTPLDPQTLYAACKASTSQVLGQLLPSAGVEFAWCRVFYLYGEGEDARRLVPYLHRQLGSGQPVELTSGRQIRDYLDVKDAGTMLAEAALGDLQGPVNICSGVPVTVRQLAEQIADAYGRRDLLRFGVRADNAFDPPCIVGIPWNRSATAQPSP
ncbi:MAG: NAD-dependent epimerase/dehydratase family protein [Pseudohaliea sp.]